MKRLKSFGVAILALVLLVACGRENPVAQGRDDLKARAPHKSLQESGIATELDSTVEGDVLKLVNPHNFPNPLSVSSTTISFTLSQGADITIRIYDPRGNLIGTIATNEHRDAGRVVVFKWDYCGVPWMNLR